MCTALSLVTKDHYFGRTLDIDCSYGEEVCVMPRRFPLDFRLAGASNQHYAMIGMATVADGAPLFYEAANEYGLCMAGLNFPGNAHYFPPCEDKDNIAPFEFIPWVLGQCQTVEQAKERLLRVNLVDIPYSEALPTAPLHWMISDGQSSIVAESMKNGLNIHDNPVGVLTNNPPFEHQLESYKQYSHLSVDNSDVVRSDNLPYETYSQGMGAVGLPGDVSSMSRFVRMAFARNSSVCGEDEASSVGQFFHLLSTVEMVRGVCRTDEGRWDITVYSACINADKGLYYYTTYGNRRISCVDMHATALDSDTISRFPLDCEQSIRYLN